MRRTQQLRTIFSLLTTVVLLLSTGFASAQPRPRPRPPAAGPQPPAGGQPPASQPPRQQQPPAGGAQGGQQPAGQPAGQPAAGEQPPASGAPFQLTRGELAALERLLSDWQQASSTIESLSCNFHLYEYDPVFGTDNEPARTTTGEIKFIAPDRGLYREAGEGGQHWVCDGRAVYQYDAPNKVLHEFHLPAEMQGDAITNSPLPFFFGASAEALKRRYFLRIITPQDARTRNQVWLEAFPRWQQDAANFSRVEIILTVPDLMPYGMKLVMPNGRNHTVYVFEKIKTNDPLEQLLSFFNKPRTPLGWERRLQESEAPQEQAQSGGQPSEQPAPGAQPPARPPQQPRPRVGQAPPPPGQPRQRQ